MEYINKQGVLDEIHRLSESTIVCYIDPDDIEALDTIDIVRCGERGDNGFGSTGR